MIILDCEQGTQEWIDARLGIPTASNFSKIITTKGIRSKSRNEYLYKLAGEVVTGIPADNYTNQHMERGSERESESRSHYEFENNVDVKQVGFVYYDEKKQFGCSPDGLVGDVGGFETKDALPHIHINRLENGWKESEHFQQVQGCLLITRRKWWDLQSYCRGFEPTIKRFERNEEFILTLKKEIDEFIADLDNIVKKYSYKG